jgi:hypothetical protein
VDDLEIRHVIIYLPEKKIPNRVSPLLVLSKDK